jgi:hypothetical protein
MWRIGLIALGGLAGWKLAKMGKSRYNFIVATVAAALVYKMTRDRMIAAGEVNPEDADVREVDVEVT